jgi:hypothetical protein
MIKGFVSKSLSLLCLAAASILEAETVSSWNFSDGFGPWKPLYTGTWETDAAAETIVLSEPGSLRPPVRRPTAFLLLPDLVWTDVTLTVEGRTLEDDAVIKRDIVLLFGYQDDTHFYYAHLSSLSDGEFHNVIMKVDGDQRGVIQNEALPPARLTDAWHQLRVSHEADGSIAVFLDDFETPLITANDDSYPAGAVGFGSFDDRAEFRSVTVSGERVAAAPPVPVWNGTGWTLSVPTGFHPLIEFSANLEDWESLENLPTQSKIDVELPGNGFLQFEFEGPQLPVPD